MIIERIVIERAANVKARKKKYNYSIRFPVPVAPGSKKFRWSPWKKIVAKNQAQLDACIAEYRAELEESINESFVTNDMSLKDYAWRFHEDRFDKGEIAETTYDRETSVIKDICKAKFALSPMNAITTEVIENYIHTLLEDGYSRDKVNRILSKVSQIFNYAKAHKRLKYNPCEPIKFNVGEEKERIPFTDEEVVFMMKVLSRSPKSGFVVAHRIVAELGLRRGEALGLMIQDVDLEEKIIHVVRQFNKKCKLVDCKYESRRDIPISSYLAKYLEEWFDYIKRCYWDGKEVPGDFPVCCTETGGFFNPSNFDRRRRQWFVELGLGRYTIQEVKTDENGVNHYRRSGYVGHVFHELRHTALSNMLAGGSDLKTVMSIAGHKKIGTTQKYLHAKETKQREAVETYAETLLNVEEE